MAPQGIHISPVGAIPKKHKPGKYQLIMDLSSPKNFSINDGIDPALSSLLYVSIDHLSSLILSLGRGALLVKSRLQRSLSDGTYSPSGPATAWCAVERSLLIECYHLASVQHPKIFSAVADALQWILSTKGISHSLHYLDDCIMVTDSIDKALIQNNILTSTFESLGVPLEYSKLEGPSPCMTFLGIEVDADSLQLRFPSDGLSRLKYELSRCYHRRSISGRELQSLTGLLQFASKVIHPGCPFIRRLLAK